MIQPDPSPMNAVNPVLLELAMPISKVMNEMKQNECGGPSPQTILTSSEALEAPLSLPKYPRSDVDHARGGASTGFWCAASHWQD